jgi:hypothetical protein
MQSAHEPREFLVGVYDREVIRASLVGRTFQPFVSTEVSAVSDGIHMRNVQCELGWATRVQIARSAVESRTWSITAQLALSLRAFAVSMVLLGCGSLLAGEPDDIRRTLENLGYVVRESSTEEPVEVPDELTVDIDPRAGVQCRIESVSIEMHPEHSRTPLDPHFTCVANFHWGRTEVASAGAECPVRTHLIIHSDDGKQTTAGAHLRFYEGSPARASVNLGVQLRDPRQSARAALVVIGADSLQAPRRLMAYHEFVLPASGSTLSAEQVEFKRRLEDLGYMVRDISESEVAEREKPPLLIRPLPTTQCRVESISVEMQPTDAAAPAGADVRFTAMFRCGQGDIAGADVQIPLRAHLIIESEDGLEMKAFQSQQQVQIAAGQPAQASISMAQQLPLSLRSGRAKFVILGASEGDPWTLMVSHRCALRGLSPQ